MLDDSYPRTSRWTTNCREDWRQRKRIPEANKEKSKLWYSPAAPTMPNIFIFLLIVSWVGFSMCQSFSNASTTTPEQILSKNGTITGELSKTSTTKPNEPSTSPIRTSEKPIDPEDEAAKILLQNITSNAELTGVRESKKASTTPSTPTSTQSTLEEDDVLIKLLKAPQRPTVRRGWHRPWRPNSYFEYKTDWNNSVQVLVTKESWESYSRFKEETCREANDTYIAERVLHDTTDHPYFKWEENVFHQELRKIILPETSDGSYSKLIGTPWLTTLDSRFFMSKPESLCKSKKRDTADNDAARIKAEQDLFEDYLINKVFPESMIATNMTSDGQLVPLTSTTSPPLLSLVIPLISHLRSDNDASSLIDVMNALDKEHVKSQR
ncbi:hypothetical protein DdX_00071 [Ditylenchus destructor]|uniref:Uncharacterized protein n=1 Tax=Ditylenchus destructor TaxID=166010 RepID=A0AAD4NJX2_9BILA|nr:hypothetical protein DdX_00071 [Ditylenchus destructor]